MVNDEPTEMTFYVVEDNSAVTVRAASGRKYASPYLLPSGLTDVEMFWGYWSAKSAKVNEFAYKFNTSYTWDSTEQKFTGGKVYMADPLTGEETTEAYPASTGRYMTVRKDYSVTWIAESNFAKLVPVDGEPPPSFTPDPAGNTAYPSTQRVNVDGKAVEFQCYALKDEKGNDTNYIKLRDLADILNGTAAQFQVGWDGSVTITTGEAYTPNGSEQNTPFSGERTYQEAAAGTKINGQKAELAAFVLNDDAGGGYTYYQLRDLGRVLGFNVGWSGEKGIFVETGKPYDAND